MSMEERDTQYTVWETAGGDENLDQFELLEKKIDHLIETIKTLRSEKESFEERFHIQEEKIADMTQQLESLRSSRDQAKQKLISLLEKIEQIEG